MYCYLRSRLPSKLVASVDLIAGRKKVSGRLGVAVFEVRGGVVKRWGSGMKSAYRQCSPGKWKRTEDPILDPQRPVIPLKSPVAGRSCRLRSINSLLRFSGQRRWKPQPASMQAEVTVFMHSAACYGKSSGQMQLSSSRRCCWSGLTSSDHREKAYHKRQRPCGRKRSCLHWGQFDPSLTPASARLRFPVHRLGNGHRTQPTAPYCSMHYCWRRRATTPML